MALNGLDLFRDRFAGCTDVYIIIGGTACTLIMQETGEEFRSTKDIDLVLCAERIQDGFAQTFWDFIGAGGYKTRNHGSGQKVYYRFSEPENTRYPAMIELFSRAPDGLTPGPDDHLVAIPMDGPVSSLSSILLDDEYYDFILKNRILMDSISLANASCLVALKAKAWLDLTDRKRKGEMIDSNDISKHRNDIFRLLRVAVPGDSSSLPLRIAHDLRCFAEEALSKPKVLDMRNYGYASREPDGFRRLLFEYYGLD